MNIGNCDDQSFRSTSLEDVIAPSLFPIDISTDAVIDIRER